MPESLVLDDLTKRYGQDALIFEGLNRTFAPGTATGLVGANGSGKTTLLNVIAVLSYPTSGQVLYGSLNIHESPYRYLQHVGIVHDDPDLPAYLSAVEMMEWVLRARSKWNDNAPNRVNDLLDTVRLDERRHNLIGTYSSGMQRKTQIAAALAPQPDVLLMDEPFRGLDDVSRKAVEEQLRAFRKRDGVLILASHLKASLEAVCDTFMEMEHGAAADGQVVDGRS